MRIDGIDNLTVEELQAELAAGGRFVFYEFCISFIVLSLRGRTHVRYLRPWEYGVVPGLPWVLLSVLLGWWGIPWGIIYTPLTMFTNLCGGHDVTDEVSDFVLASKASAAGSVLPEGPVG